MATELAAAYISLIPTFKSGQSKIKDELEKETEPASKETGEKGGESFKGAFTGALTGMLAGGAIDMGLDLLLQTFSTELDKAGLPAQFQAQFAQTPEQAAESAKIAGDLYAQNWGASIADIGNAVGSVQRALEGLGTGEDVKTLTAQAQALADTFGEDVNGVVTAASQLVKTGLAPDMATAFDTITKGFQGGANSGQDLLDTITEYSVQFGKLGLDATTSLGLMNQGLAGGARNSDLVADALKEFSIRASDGSAEAAAAFEALGLNAAEMTAIFNKGGPEASAALDTVLDKLRETKGDSDAAAIAFGLFGTQSEDLKDALYELDPSAVAATGSMEGVEGAAQNLADTVGGAPAASLATLGRAAQDSLGSAMSWVIPLLSGFLKVITPFAPILGPIALAIGVLTAAQWLWNAALAANPIVLIIIGIVALIAAVVWLWNNVEGFKNFFIGAWDAIVGAFNWVLDFVKQHWQLILGLITGPIGIAVYLITKYWDNIVAAFKAAINWVVGIVKKGINLAIGYFKWWWSLPGRFGQMLGSVYTRVKDKLGDIVSFVKGLPGKIRKVAVGAFDGLKTAFKSAVNSLIGIWNNFSLTIGGGSVLGVSIPSITLNTPNIPYLAKGGVIPRTPGGMPFFGGDGREAEAVQPLSHLDSMLDAAVERGGGQIDYDRLAEAIARAMPDLRLVVDSREIARANLSGSRRLARQG